MGIYKLIVRRRSIRKFQQKKIKKSILLDCLNTARLAPSAANLQPLEFILATKNLDKIFENLKWSAYLKNGAPQKNEKPTAYIVIISNVKINKEARYDAGFAVENIILTAIEKGVNSCVIGSVNRNELIKFLNIPKNYVIELVLALGYPKQRSFEEKFKGSYRYWLDKKGNLHIPKRKLQDILHEERF
ncbi:MAG: nitroreductase family protein [Candidatus Nealsonbacteria bacterium]